MWEANPMQDLFGNKSQQLGTARPVTAQLTEEDLEVDRTLRPKTLISMWVKSACAIIYAY